MKPEQVLEKERLEKSVRMLGQELEQLRATHAECTEINLQREAQKSEIAEMLMHEGLAEIVTSSLSEQVAYLLAERAALMQKIQALENADTKTLSMKRTSMQATPDEKVAPLQGQSPWKRLLVFRKSVQTKQNSNQDNEDKESQDRERSLLEKDLEEASTRLNLAHKEIQRLTGELESAHLTSSAYDLAVAQMAEICRLKDIVHSMDEHLLELLAAVRTKEAEETTLQLQDEDNGGHVQHLQQNGRVAGTLEQHSTQGILKTMLLKQENLKLRQELEKLEMVCEKHQVENQQINCSFHCHVRKYDEMKLHYREKQAKAKEMYLRELTLWSQKVHEQEEELEILTKRLKKENDMVKMVTAENDTLLLIKKTLQCQLSEAEEDEKNAAAKLSALQIRVSLLEKDNMFQWEMNMKKSTQISKLEKRLRDMQCVKSSPYMRKHQGIYFQDTEEASVSDMSSIPKTQDSSAEKSGFSSTSSQSFGSEMSYKNMSC